MKHDDAGNFEARWFWTLSSELHGGSKHPLEDTLDELELLRDMTSQPRIKQACNKLLLQYAVCGVGASAS